jgi:hypothetical protein
MPIDGKRVPPRTYLPLPGGHFQSASETDVTPARKLAILLRLHALFPRLNSRCAATPGAFSQPRPSPRHGFAGFLYPTRLNLTLHLACIAPGCPCVAFRTAQGPVPLPLRTPAAKPPPRLASVPGRRMTNFCSFRVTHTENTIRDRILRAGKHHHRYHPRRRGMWSACPSSARGAYGAPLPPPDPRTRATFRRQSRKRRFLTFPNPATRRGEYR